MNETFYIDGKKITYKATWKLCFTLCSLHFIMQIPTEFLRKIAESPTDNLTVLTFEDRPNEEVTGYREDDKMHLTLTSKDNLVKIVMEIEPILKRLEEEN